MDISNLGVFYDVDSTFEIGALIEVTNELLVAVIWEKEFQLPFKPHCWNHNKDWQCWVGLTKMFGNSSCNNRLTPTAIQLCQNKYYF